jgi:peptidoglycan hydrolase-like protein with peptidoglycan-binding domain
MVTNIRKAQESLRDKGYARGPINGNLRAETRAAISKFQASENLTVTGQLDTQTAARLGVQPEPLKTGGREKKVVQNRILKKAL